MPKRNRTLEAELMDLTKFGDLMTIEPVEHLELRRLEYIMRVEKIADECRADGDKELELKALAYLIRLTSVYKQKVDVSSSNLGLIKAPDLSKLSDADIKQLETADAEVMATLAAKVTIDD